MGGSVVSPSCTDKYKQTRKNYSRHLKNYFIGWNYFQCWDLFKNGIVSIQVIDFNHLYISSMLIMAKFWLGPWFQQNSIYRFVLQPPLYRAERLLSPVLGKFFRDAMPKFRGIPIRKRMGLMYSVELIDVFLVPRPPFLYAKTKLRKHFYLGIVKNNARTFSSFGGCHGIEGTPISTPLTGMHLSPCLQLQYE